MTKAGTRSFQLILVTTKIRNIRRDPRVALTVISLDRSGTFTPYLSVSGTARIEEGAPRSCSPNWPRR